MKLCYRGLRYQPKVNAVETVETGTIARFLGKTYTVRQTKYLIFEPANFYKYRGRKYQK